MHLVYLPITVKLGKYIQSLPLLLSRIVHFHDFFLLKEKEMRRDEKTTRYLQFDIKELSRRTNEETKKQWRLGFKERRWKMREMPS